MKLQHAAFKRAAAQWRIQIFEAPLQLYRIFVGQSTKSARSDGFDACCEGARLGSMAFHTYLLLHPFNEVESTLLKTLSVAMEYAHLDVLGAALSTGRGLTHEQHRSASER
eukprot:GHVU01121459.1.p1 GENE.GHVU01121459.1~~GHVU01121459.1.p1  ORF type:complete len:111 (+),score=7.09 GHVU01121459.1:173-505(+)